MVISMDMDIENKLEFRDPYETTRIHQISKSLTPLCTQIRYSTIHSPEYACDWQLAYLLLDSFTSHLFRPNLRHVSRLSLDVSNNNYGTASLALLHLRNISHLSLDLEQSSDVFPSVLSDAVSHLPELKTLRLRTFENSEIVFQDRSFTIRNRLPRLKALESGCSLANLLLDEQDSNLARLAIRNDEALKPKRIPWTTLDDLTLDTEVSEGLPFDFIEEMGEAFDRVSCQEYTANEGLSTIHLRRLAISYTILSPFPPDPAPRLVGAHGRDCELNLKRLLNQLRLTRLSTLEIFDLWPLERHWFNGSSECGISLPSVKVVKLEGKPLETLDESCRLAILAFCRIFPNLRQLEITGIGTDTARRLNFLEHRAEIINAVSEFERSSQILRFTHKTVFYGERDGPRARERAYATEQQVWSRKSVEDSFEAANGSIEKSRSWFA